VLTKTSATSARAGCVAFFSSRPLLISVTAVPEWLGLGLAIAGVLAILFALLFVLGERLFPTEPIESGNGRDSEWKRRAEIRTYLDAIGERYAENHPVSGHSVAFFLPERNVAITFDGVAFFRIQKTDTVAILVEHEMPGAHLGARLPFETPDRSPQRGPAGAEAQTDGVTSAFRVLGLSPDADAEAVTAAYRERVKDVHPDHGGDEATFRRVREAYTAAKQAAS
jgi:hypothetical protein